jgi:chromosome segregation ATPase
LPDEDPPTAPRPPFLRRPAAGWIIGGVLALVTLATAIALLVAYQTAQQRLKRADAQLVSFRQDLTRAESRIGDLDRQISAGAEENTRLERELRACSRAITLSVELWNKHIDEMDAALAGSFSEFDRLREEAEEARKRANRAFKRCP